MDEPKTPLPRLAGRVLLVDDETAVLLMGQRLLAEIGCQVIICQDPAQALALFRQDPGAFDMVLTDYAMPGMTGCDLAMELLSCRPDIPILLLSGSVAEMAESPAACPGIREFLAKPVRLAELAAVLARYLPNL